MHPFRLIGLVGATVLLAPALLASSIEPSEAVPLGVQSCDTQCQTDETDCDLACDQVVACVEECKKASEACVKKCRDAPPAEPKPVGSSSAKPIAPPAKKGAPKPPAKAPPPAKPKAA